MAYKTAAPYREYILQRFGGLYTEADPRSLPPGASPLCYDVDFLMGQFTMRPGQSVAIPQIAPPYGFFQWFKTSPPIPIGQYTLIQDSIFGLWGENLLNQGNLFPIRVATYITVGPNQVQTGTGILNHARAISETFDQAEYICLSDLVMGQDQPLQYNWQHLDRISQVAPGVGPTAPSVAAILNSILSILQSYTAQTINSACWGSLINLYHAEPAGTTLTIFGPVSAGAAWIGDVQIGDNIYISGMGNLAGVNPNGTYAVTGTGYFTDVDGTYPYIQVNGGSSNSDFARGTAGGTYQKTIATITLGTGLPLENAEVGNNLVIAGATPTSWNGSWPIADTPTVGQLLIQATSLAANVATYTYAVSSGNGPGWQSGQLYLLGSQVVDSYGHLWQVTTPGTSGSSVPFPSTPAGPVADGTVTWAYQSGVTMKVTVFNTSNGNGVFNVQTAAITSATPTTFTVAITAPNVGSAAEQGLAVSGSATILSIDPGAISLGTGHPGKNPIYGNDTGTGNVSVEGSTVTPGQRYAVTVFLTRNGAITPASPPVSFFTTGDTTTVEFSNLPIGPPDVIARIVAITAANSGIGGPYFWIPKAVIISSQAAALGETVTVSATIINDNVSLSTGALTFNDAVLLASTNITENGNNLLQQRELAECVKAVEYFGRVFYLGERVKVDNFLNMTFDGGAIGSATGPPAGWNTQPQTSDGANFSVSVQPSFIVNTCIYLQNSTSGTMNAHPLAGGLPDVACLWQSAYQDAYLTPIIDTNTQYSVRITAAIAVPTSQGTLTVELFSPSAPSLAYQFNVPFASLQMYLLEFAGAFTSQPLWGVVPSDLQLRVYATDMAAGAILVIDRIEVFPTNQAVYTRQLAASYLANTEAIDAVTGIVDTSAFTAEVQTNLFRFLEQLYVTTDSHTFAVRNEPSEPSDWEIRETSNTIGCLGPLASDEGEEFVVIAARKGAYIFDGGNHSKISQEIQKVWDALYQPALSTIWVKNDIRNKRFLFGVPLPTPNPWLPNAATNAAPTTPNVILACSYIGLETGAAIAEGEAVVVSMFSGALLYKDGRRKWTIWQIPAAYGNFIARENATQQFWLGLNGQINYIDPTSLTDNGAAIPERYQTFGFNDKETEQGLQLGAVRKLYSYAVAKIEGAGAWNLTTLPETPATPYATTQPPFPLQNPATDDQNAPINETANALFLDLAVDGTPGSWFALRQVVLGLTADPWIPISGR